MQGILGAFCMFRLVGEYDELAGPGLRSERQTENPLKTKYCDTNIIISRENLARKNANAK
jgi:hypothetical protein